MFIEYTNPNGSKLALQSLFETERTAQIERRSVRLLMTKNIFSFYFKKLKI